MKFVEHSIIYYVYVYYLLENKSKFYNFGVYIKINKLILRNILKHICPKPHFLMQERHDKLKYVLENNNTNVV